MNLIIAGHIKLVICKNFAFTCQTKSEDKILFSFTEKEGFYVRKMGGRTFQKWSHLGGTSVAFTVCVCWEGGK